jgi:hypothetical protein
MVEVRDPYVGVEEELRDLPDRVADAQRFWKAKEAELKHERARVYLSFKSKLVGTEPTQGDLKAMVENDMGIYQLSLDCVTAESEYTRLMEKLMAAKRLASLRSAF